ncbi:MAG: P-II family nitrogen regulator [Candidatus Nitrosocosmicus sp.]|nr:P-II family nitrogen regulator [Candidatus Nitrosocosmicus sp.]
MKEINVYIRPNDLSKVTDILQKHKLGITFFDIQGTGRTPRSTSEIIHSYQTGRTTVPKFIGRVLVISIVSDSIVNQIIEEIMHSFDKQDEPYGVLFVKDVTNAYELGTELKGDGVLVSK